MRPIDLITKHFDQIGTQHIDVPEWADEKGVPLRIFWQPLTLTEAQKIAREADGQEVIRYADVIVLKAMTEAGEKMFDLEDKLKLRDRADPRVLMRVGQAMLASPSPEELKKN